MKVSVKPVLFLLSSIALLLGGCASSSLSSSADTTPEAGAAAAMQRFHKAELTGDVDGMVESFSDNWSNPEGATKAVLRDYFEGAVAQGAFQNMTIDVEKAVYTLDDGIVTAIPIIYRSAAGPASFVYRFKQEEKGIWRIVSSYQIN